MKLPNAHLAIVEEEKITEYLPSLIVLLAVVAFPALSMALTNRRSDFTTSAVAA